MGKGSIDRCLLVESDDPTVVAERVTESKPDDDTGENFLPCRASTSHVHLDLVLHHHYLPHQKRRAESAEGSCRMGEEREEGKGMYSIVVALSSGRGRRFDRFIRVGPDDDAVDIYQQGQRTSKGETREA
jgi:hypothetical protein